MHIFIFPAFSIPLLIEAAMETSPNKLSFGRNFFVFGFVLIDAENLVKFPASA